MGRSVHVRNRARLKHRGRSADPRKRRRANMRWRGDFKQMVALDPSKKTSTWWAQFTVARLLNKWRGGES
jgi:hypothetical protein